MSVVVSFESVAGFKTLEDIVMGLVYLAMTGGRSWSNGMSKVKLWEHNSKVNRKYPCYTLLKNVYLKDAAALTSIG